MCEMRPMMPTLTQIRATSSAAAPIVQVTEEMRFGTDEAPKARDAVVLQVIESAVVLQVIESAALE